MSLLDKARAAATTPKAICGVALVKMEHPELADEIDELNRAHPGVPYSVQSATLKREAGIDLKADTLSRHNRGICSCPVS